MLILGYCYASRYCILKLNPINSKLAAKIKYRLKQAASINVGIMFVTAFDSNRRLIERQGQ
jgi:hypothetical protein